MKAMLRLLTVVSVMGLCLAPLDGGALAEGPAAPTAASPAFVEVQFDYFSERTQSVAWGDYDGDGDLDLAAGNERQPNRVYENEGGKVQFNLAQGLGWEAPISEATYDVAWGDYDLDGDLDLAVGNGCTNSYPEVCTYPNRVYSNDGHGGLTLAWTAPEIDRTLALAWGDYDGDGDLDLVVMGWFTLTKTRVYEYVGGAQQFVVGWESASDTGFSLAWGDMDGDGDLDLALGRASYNRVYRNLGGGNLQLYWESAAYNYITEGVAWGDYDNDGDLDLAMAGVDWDNRVYENTGSGFQWDPANGWGWTVGGGGNDVEWGDYDGDGDLDLAIAGVSANIDVVYENVGGQPYLDPANGLGWQSTAQYAIGLAWGDYDGDGDLDLASARSSRPNLVYENVSPALDFAPANGLGWQAPLAANFNSVYSVAWGDYDSDGDLDLAIGYSCEYWHNDCQPVKVYRNGPAGTLQFAWQAPTPTFAFTYSVAWGDYDGDGDLDLAVGNHDETSKLYQYVGGAQQFVQSWDSGYANTHSVAWGDYDNDGDLDLAMGFDNRPNMVFENDGSALRMDPANGWGWRAPVSDSLTQDVAWGDYDNDGDLDLAVGGASDKVYENVGGGLYFDLANGLGWQSMGSGGRSLAWGDYDGDGDLDLASAVGVSAGHSKVYENEGGTLYFDPPNDLGWLSSESRSTWEVAWGDYDGDGDLDLATANFDQPSIVYVNDNGALRFDLANGFGWEGPVYASDWISSVAWGDYDNDGDLDLMEGHSSETQASRVQENLGHSAGPALNRPAIFVEGLSSAVRTYNGGLASSLAPADGYAISWVRSAGVIPITYRLAIPSGAAQTITAEYSLNGGGKWYPAAAASGTLTENLTCGADPAALVGYWPLDDGSGATAHDASGNGYDLGLFAPDYTAETAPAVHASAYALDFAAGDYASVLPTSRIDSLQDLTLALWVRPDSVPASGIARFITLSNEKAVLRIQNGDLHFYMNIGGMLRHIIVGNLLQAGVYQHVAGTYDSTANSMRLYYNGRQVGAMTIDGAVGAGNGVFLSSGAEAYDGLMDDVRVYNRALTAEEVMGLARNFDQTCTGTYTWDVFNSYFFGQSDNVLFRLTARPELYPQPGRIAGPYHHPQVTTATFPLRVRGSVVRVMEAGLPVKGAQVYRLPVGQGAGVPYADLGGRPYATNQWGYLPGNTVLTAGDQLVALLPISTTAAYTLYHTSAAPVETGLAAFTVQQRGVQTLTVTPEYPLALFNLDISLEWDARYDAAYLEALEDNLQRVSAVLYDWTNGQAALGRTTVYHDRQQWDEADIRIYATNRLRPNANQGGVVEAKTTDPDNPAVTYKPGQVRMGVVWNRYGNPGGSMGDDWPRTLAHELGHYLFYLDDNYLGLVGGMVAPLASCPGAMSNPYRQDVGNDEFHPAADWTPECAETLSNQTTGRADWATLTAFYPELWAPTSSITLTNQGPSRLPLAVTQVRFAAPAYPSTALVDPTFYLTDEVGNHYEPGRGARAFLFQTVGGVDRLVDLGSPVYDRVLARGVRADVGDRLCVFEAGARRWGCEMVVSNDVQLALAQDANWQPEILITPGRTYLTVAVTAPAGLTLQARLFPASGAPSAPLALTGAGTSYTGTFSTPTPAATGYVQVWVEEAEPRREAVTDYALGGSPGPHGAGSGSGSNAPAVSADGQVILYGVLDFPEGEFYTLQALSVFPQPLEWATPIGAAYRLIATAGAPPLQQAALSLAYMAGDVPPGEEPWIRAYYWNGSAWTILPTALDTDQNTAAAPVQGPGVYALMSSYQVRLDPGWNLMAYPVYGSRPVGAALGSLGSNYGLVYAYDSSDPVSQWRMYSPDVPAWVNDLTELAFGRGYWISVTQNITTQAGITLYLKGAGMSTGLPTLPEGVTVPPSTFYGTLSGRWAQPAGTAVTAWVNGKLCGSGQTMLAGEGVIGYVVKVLAELQTPGCGAPGRAVSLRAGAVWLPWSGVWDSDRATRLDFFDLLLRFLPLVVGW